MKYEINSNVVGKVTGISKYGLFLKIDEEYSGLIHISEISTKFVKDIRKYYVIGENVEAKIISVDDEKKHLKLSLKEICDFKKNAKVLKEDGRGFEPLKENLEIWVKNSLIDIKNYKK